MNSFLDKSIALVLFFFSLPLYPILFLLIKTTSTGPFIFSQQRLGLNKKKFSIYKFRTMVDNAEKLKAQYLDLDEADGPVFKIRNDPRYTKIGRFLARTALDELPQLINVIKGEMAFVGPRPLPINEAKLIPEKYSLRFSILPGLTSPWVIKGSHKMLFKEWMKLDVEYVSQKNFWYDIEVLAKTFILVIKSWFSTHD